MCKLSEPSSLQASIIDRYDNFHSKIIISCGEIKNHKQKRVHTQPHNTHTKRYDDDTYGCDTCTCLSFQHPSIDHSINSININQATLKKHHHHASRLGTHSSRTKTTTVDELVITDKEPPQNDLSSFTRGHRLDSTPNFLWRLAKPARDGCWDASFPSSTVRYDALLYSK